MGALLATTGREPNPGRDDRVPLVIAYHPALNTVGKHGISCLSFPNRKSIRKFLLYLRSLHLDGVRALRIYQLGKGLLTTVTVIKGAVLVVKSPDVKCVNLCLIVIVSIPK